MCLFRSFTCSIILFLSATYLTEVDTKKGITIFTLMSISATVCTGQCVYVRGVHNKNNFFHRTFDLARIKWHKERVSDLLFFSVSDMAMRRTTYTQFSTWRIYFVAFFCPFASFEWARGVCVCVCKLHAINNMTITSHHSDKCIHTYADACTHKCLWTVATNLATVADTYNA